MSTIHSISKHTEVFNLIDHHMLKAAEQQPAQPAGGGFGAAVEHLAQVYAGIRPLLAALEALPWIPPYWKSVLATLTLAIDAVLAGAAGAGIDPNFKAGKDL